MPGQLEPEFDSITLEIMWNRLISIADQAATTLVRTSFSTIVRECNDYACVLMDRNGDTLAENRGAIPSLVGTLSRTMKHFLRRFPPQTWRPGDVVITNDPWMGTGHRPDFTMTTPRPRVGHRRRHLLGGLPVRLRGGARHTPDETLFGGHSQRGAL